MHSASCRAFDHDHGRRKYIAFTAQRLDVAGLARYILQALPQAADQQIDRPVERIGLATLGQVEQLIPREYALWMIEEHPQQAVLRAAQRHHGALSVEQMARGGVEPPVAEADHWRGLRY